MSPISKAFREVVLAEVVVVLSNGVAFWCAPKVNPTRSRLKLKANFLYKLCSILKNTLNAFVCTLLKVSVSMFPGIGSEKKATGPVLPTVYFAGAVAKSTLLPKAPVYLRP